MNAVLIARRAIATILLTATAVSGAAELELQLQAGIGYSDNIIRAPDTLADPAVEEVILDAGLVVEFVQQSARADVDLRGSLFFVDYSDETFESETVPALDASAIFRVTKEALRWFVQGNVGQQTINPFLPTTPENRGNVVYLTTGPSLRVPIGSRFSVGMDAWYSDVDYEEQPLDNSRQGARVSLIRALNPNRTVSLNFSGEQTEFDDESAYAPSERYQGYFSLESEGSRNEVVLDLGWSRSNRAGQTLEEPLVNLEWERQMSSTTSLSANVGTRISDAADSFRGRQQGRADLDAVHNQQTVADPYREDYLGLSFVSNRPRTRVLVSAGISEEEFESQSQLNRRALRGSLDINRQLGNDWTIGMFGGFSTFEYDVQNRDDDEARLGVSITWEGLRTMELELSIERIDQDSTDQAAVYTENRAYLGFRYIPEFGT
jgi:hypothetical protein